MIGRKILEVSLTFLPSALLPSLPVAQSVAGVHLREQRRGGGR
jgi:hypothetical protein